MFLLSHLFYWCSDGCPDAVPAGTLAFKLGLNEASYQDEDIDEIWRCVCSFGLADDAAWQLGFTNENIDLVRKDPEGNGNLSYLTANQICSDWQWELIKQHPGLNYVEHDLEKTMDEFIAEQEEG